MLAIDPYWTSSRGNIRRRREGGQTARAAAPAGMLRRVAVLPDSSTASAPRRQLTLLDTTCIIVGIIIGAGFFETPPQIAAAGGTGLLMALWVAGGAMALVGALCYAELAAAYPRDGGEYVFLTQAFGRRIGFLYAWAWFFVVRPGNLG